MNRKPKRILQWKDINSPSFYLQEMKQKMSDGGRLLELFREEQSIKGHNGCTCNDCQEDMENAYQKFKEGLDG